MKGKKRAIWMAGVLLAATLLPVWGEENEKLESFRQAFEKRMNAELDEHGKKARNLRESYLIALNRLKTELGREGNLKAAAQVLAEIEAVEGGEEAEPLRSDADFRLKQVRKKWDDGLEAILEERATKIETTAKLYLKALDGEKRKLTRVGKIKEALLFEEEEKRVRELPEIKAALQEDQDEDPTDEVENLKEFLVGTSWNHRVVGKSSQGGVIRFFESGKGDYRGGSLLLNWRVRGQNTAVVSSSAWPAPLVLTFSEDRSAYTATMKGDKLKRVGRLLKEE